MNTEQLKMIVDMIGSLGANGKDAFIAYLIANYGLSFVGMLVTIILIAWVLVKIASMVYLYYKDADAASRYGRLDNAVQAVRHWWLYAEGTEGAEAYKIYDQMKAAQDKYSPKEKS